MVNLRFEKIFCQRSKGTGTTTRPRGHFNVLNATAVMIPTTWALSWRLFLSKICMSH